MNKSMYEQSIWWDENIILVSTVSTVPFLSAGGNCIHPELSFKLILDPGLIVAGLMALPLLR